MPALRRWAAPAVLTIATVLTVAACDGDDSSQAGGATTTAATTTTTISGSSTSGEPTTTTEPATPAIEVRVAGGKVQGGVRRERVRSGDTIVLRVVADVGGEIERVPRRTAHAATSRGADRAHAGRQRPFQVE